MAVLIRAQRPSIGVVFTSGYAVDALGRGAGLKPEEVGLEPRDEPFLTDDQGHPLGGAAIEGFTIARTGEGEEDEFTPSQSPVRDLELSRGVPSDRALALEF